MTTKADPGGRNGRGARAAFLVGAGIFLSRVSGFIRESVFAYYFGASGVADVWRVALRTPNVIQNLLGEGTLSASLIPVYSEFLEQGKEEEAGRFAGASLGILSVLAFSLALIGILLAPWIVPLLYPDWGDEPWKYDLVVRIVRVLFPMTAVLVVSAWALGILNSHRRFFASYVAPVAWNLALITAMVTAGSWLGWAAAGREADLAMALAWGGLAGGILQLLVQTPWLLPLLKGFRLSLGRRVAGVREAVRNFMPVVAARGVGNISSWLDTILAHFLATGALAMLGYAHILYLLPISLFGLAIAASELPELSRKREEVQEVMVPRVRTALGRLAFLLIPSAMAYLVLGDIFVAGLFERGAFGPDETVVTHGILAAFALGLPAAGSSRALSSTFYALRDTRTPALIAGLRVLVAIGIGVALMLPLDQFGVGERRFGAVGLAFGTAAASWMEFGLLRWRLGKPLGPHGPGFSRIGRLVLAGGLAATVGFGARSLLGFSRGPGILPDLLGSESFLLDPLAAAGTATLFGVTYLSATRALGVGASLGRSRA